MKGKILYISPKASIRNKVYLFGETTFTTSLFFFNDDVSIKLTVLKLQNGFDGKSGGSLRKIEGFWKSYSAKFQTSRVWLESKTTNIKPPRGYQQKSFISRSLHLNLSKFIDEGNYGFFSY